MPQIITTQCIITVTISDLVGTGLKAPSEKVVDRQDNPAEILERHFSTMAGQVLKVAKEKIFVPALGPTDDNGDKVEQAAISKAGNPSGSAVARTAPLVSGLREQRKQKTVERHQVWQRMAEEIKMKHQTWRKSPIAREIEKILRRDDSPHWAEVKTISNNIKI